LLVADPGGREMMISCGAALFTARLALRALGYIPHTCVLPDPAQPSLVARLHRRHWSDGTYPQLLGTVVQATASIRRPPGSELFPGGGEPPGRRPGLTAAGGRSAGRS
jgi:hypothetical protein